MTIENVIREHMGAMCEKIAAFNNTGYSFEEWINWELFYALSKAQIDVLPKPCYKEYSKDSPKSFGDLLVENQHFIEVSLIHDSTQNKWIEKIENERRALTTLDLEYVKPAQLLIIVSAHDDIESHGNWLPFLEKISFWRTACAWTISTKTQNGGQVIAKYWDI